jgi:hypothetical protein
MLYFSETIAKPEFVKELFMEPEANEDLASLTVSEFVCSNASICDYLSQKPLFLECSFPDNNLLLINKKKERQN